MDDKGDKGDKDNKSDKNVHQINKQHPDYPKLQTNLALYNTNNEFLPTDTLQKTISHHWFNQQVNFSLPLVSNGDTAPKMIQDLNSTIFTALQNTFVYHVQCDLGLLFTEPFVSTYFPQLITTHIDLNVVENNPKSSENSGKNCQNPKLIKKTTITAPSSSPLPPSSRPQIFATTTHTTLSQNSFSIANNSIFFNLDKDSYQSLGFTAPILLKTNSKSLKIDDNFVQFKIPINKVNISRLRTKLSQPNIAPIPFILFAQQGGISIPINFDLLKQADKFKKEFDYKQRVEFSYLNLPHNTTPKLTQNVFVKDCINNINDESIIINPEIVTNEQYTTPPSILHFKRLNYRFESNNLNQFVTIQHAVSKNNNNNNNNNNTNHNQTNQSKPNENQNDGQISNKSINKQPIPIMYKTISSEFPYLTTSSVKNYIKSFFTEKKMNKHDTECLNNLQHKMDYEIALVKHAYKTKSKLDKLTTGKDNKLVSLNNNVKNKKKHIDVNDDGDGDDGDDGDNNYNSDSSDDDLTDVDEYNPKFASYYVDKVVQSTKTPPKIPSMRYQRIANQLQYYFSLIYANNIKAWITQKEKIGKIDKNMNNFQIQNMSNYVDQISQLEFVNTTFETNTGYLTFSLRGILPPCVLLHIFKQLRTLLHPEMVQKLSNNNNNNNNNKNSNNNNNNNNNNNSSQMTDFNHIDNKSIISTPLSTQYLFMTVYGIPNAVCNYGEKFHGNSDGFGGNGDSNYTILLLKNNESNELTTKIDSQNDSHLDAFVLFRNVDHLSKEL
jgi:hypothetical protein